MPSRGRTAIYNTPTLRNGGFGALQVEAITNRPLSIARRHLAASQLRMRDIEPDQLTSSEWVRFLVMGDRERDRWMTEFNRRRRDSDSSVASSSSTAADPDQDATIAYDKAEEARLEAEEARREEQRTAAAAAPPLPHSHTPTNPIPGPVSASGSTPSVSIWARQFDERRDTGPYSARRPRHVRRAATEAVIDAPPTYENAVRARTPPPAYVPRSHGDGSTRPPPVSDSPLRLVLDT